LIVSVLFDNDVFKSLRVPFLVVDVFMVALPELSHSINIIE
jgi:hypothetical protein